MLVIGLTGPSGSGKSTVSEIFSSFGLPVISADQVYHELLVPPSPCLLELTEVFGDVILNSDGSLNRRALGAIVFSDHKALERLNAVTHRYIMAEIRARLKELREKKTPAAVLDAPQLFEAGADRDCNLIVSVLAEKSLRIDRIMRRDGIDAEAAYRRIQAQKSDEFFRLHSNYVIENNSEPSTILPTVRRILVETGVLTS